jgi:multisubunit Na+/H+ antiporter MnhG subunit
MLQAGLGLVAVKLAMIGLFMALIGPVSSHALLKAAYAHGVRVRSTDEESAHVD